ncbi:MAG: hypothetical protein KAV41_02320 [Candidatus Pacebacteria bacterium]|nr:hypothetical protein [Candidatus Paceibacterota bacterium]
MDKEVIYIFLILAGLGLVWVFFGGPERMAYRSGIFIEPPAPLDSGRTYDGKSLADVLGIKKESPPKTLSSEEKIALEIKQAEKEAREIKIILEEIEKRERTSPFSEKIKINRCRGSRADVREEYIELKAGTSVAEKIQISDWSLKSAMTGVQIQIGEASKLPYSSRVNPETAIFASGGDKIIISSGRSPIGVSFQVNKCSGYLEQFQDFEPNLKKECPLVEDENLPFSGPNAFDDDCWNYIERLPRCEIPLNLPLDMQSECRTYLTTEVNYNACLDAHKNDDDFYKQEWRVFLGREQELWKNKREIIELLDGEGKLVDVYTY